GTGKHHRGRQVDAPTQKTHRRRRMALVANRACETQAMPIGFTQIARTTARFARIAIEVQLAPTPTAAPRSGLSSQIFIDEQEERMELGVQHRRVAHRGVSLSWRIKETVYPPSGIGQSPFSRETSPYSLIQSDRILP